jgi:predicted neutral ceramidase superfamily lipid hydrolase
MSDAREKSDRQMIELLNELRVALPGVQFLFAFLLTVPFAQGFQRTTPFQRDLFYAVLVATALSTVCLIAPTATHRLRFHKNDRAYIIESASTFLIAGLVFLSLAILGAIALITDYLFDSTAVWLLPAMVAVALVVTWFLRPLLRGDRSSGPSDPCHNGVP